MGPTIRRVSFENFKALARFSADLQHMNVFVGPNNAGKSTLLGAFRVLAAGLQKAARRNPDYVDTQTSLPAYLISEDAVPISLENVQTDYRGNESTVRFTLSNDFELLLRFFDDKTTILVPNALGMPVRDTKSFKRWFPVTLGVIPQLGQIETEEPLLEEKTIRRGLNTARAPRYFRNYWWHYPDRFAEWRERVQVTWPGMDIDPPILVASDPPTLAMMCKEDRMSRELQWLGSGFQVWCQILTHLERWKDSTLLLVDEPEIYLHPEVQRQVLGLLREAGPDILVATHSTEILGEAEPHEVLLVEKQFRRARRISTLDGMSEAFHAIGSVRTQALPQIARTQRVLFVEGDDDFKILATIARRIGMPRLAARADFQLIAIRGFPDVGQVNLTCSALRSAFGADVRFAGIFDRDYRSDEEVAEIRSALRKTVSVVEV